MQTNFNRFKFLKGALLSLLMLCAPSADADAGAGTEKTLGQFSNHADIGPVKHAGTLEYDPETQQYRMSGSGTNMWFTEDELHYAWNQIEGDFIVRARVKFIGEGVNPHRKVGWHVRESLAPDAANVHATVHGDGLTSLQFRPKKGAQTEEYRLNIQGPDVIQLERRGDTFIMSAARFGELFQVTQVSHLDFSDQVLVGLAITSHDPDEVESAIFSNVRFIRPAADDFVPYQDYIGSNLEIMDMTTENRRIVYRSPYSIQAPNWTRDGETLIYNSKGLLFNFDLETNTPSTLNTGFANQNNNDHVLSWGGDEIAISHHAESEDGRSTIYTLPITGSDQPKQITKPGAGHSYLHGYSPDDQNLVFTGERNGKYDIHKVNIETGEETQLTDTATLDDGSEYSPNGEHIYFNSNRTGTMQLWRMNADGSNEVQLTFDKYNDWFPHISPEGKSIVFLSYMDDIESSDHPFYRHVYLRQMPVEGGEPTIIAYIYGGQGTINVPSWSPDGSKIAFVSNTRLPGDDQD